MNKYNNINGESILITFYNRLIKWINKYKQSINEIFSTEKGEMNIFLFKENLKQLGYTEKEIDEVNYISNYFLCRSSTQEMININEIKIQLEIYQKQQLINSTSNTGEITRKINSIKSKMNKEILNFPQFIMDNICLQIKKTLSLNKLNVDYLLKKFESKDTNKFGYVDKNYFFNEINYFYISNIYEQNIIINILNNKQNSNKNNIPYNKFCQLINDVNEDKIHNVIKEFNIKNNPYIVNMRKYIFNFGVDVRTVWSNFNKGKINISKYEFIDFIKKANLIDKNNNINDKEIEYIFNIISPNNELLNFRDFEKAINEKEFIIKKDNLRISVEPVQNTKISLIDEQNNTSRLNTLSSFNISRKSMENNLQKNLEEKNKTKQPDINYIKKLCKFVTNIIINEKKQNIEDFFKKVDSYNKGYIPIDKLKKVFKNDLKVIIDDDFSKDDFFNMIKENERIEGYDIVKIEHIIKVLRTYCGVDYITDPSDISKKQVYNIENIESLKNMIEKKEKIISNLENEISTKNCKINELENKISKLEFENHILREKEQNNFNISRTNELLKEKENEINQLKNQIKNIKIEYQNLENKYKNLQKKNESLQKEYNEINRNFKIIWGQYKEKQKK